MKKIITIMDYNNNKRKITIKNFEDVVRLEIEVVSGDEILNILYKDYSTESYDSSDCRMMNFDDDFYTIYDITKNIDYINSWNKRTSSYHYDLKSEVE